MCSLNRAPLPRQVLAQLHLKTTLAEAVTRLFGLCVNQNYVQVRFSVRYFDVDVAVELVVNTWYMMHVA